jgi:hypothetical protein
MSDRAFLATALSYSGRCVFVANFAMVAIKVIVISSPLQGPSTHTVVVDALVRERASLTSSARMIDEFTGLAGNVLTSLKSQRGVLKSAHKKVLDVSGSLGLSNSLMRIISRRTTADRILVYGGFAVLLALVALVWWLK